MISFMTFLTHFLLGLVGALLTLYLAKQVVIPELRPLYDTSGIEAEAGELRAAIADDRQRVRGVQGQLGAEPQRLAELIRLLEVYEAALRFDQGRLDVLEGRLLRNQIFSRGMGFLLFVLLGGVFAGLLTGQVTVTGFNGTLPRGFQAVAIGAAWTGFLSVFGIRNIQEAASSEIDAVQNDTVQQINSLRSALDQVVRSGPAQGPSLVPYSTQSILAAEISRRIDHTLQGVSARIGEAKVRVREDARRVI